MEKEILNKQYELQPLVEIIPYSKIQEKDVIILRCEKGQENQAISKINFTLRSLINEKNLRILDVTPHFDKEKLFFAIEMTKAWED